MLNCIEKGIKSGEVEVPIAKKSVSTESTSINEFLSKDLNNLKLAIKKFKIKVTDSKIRFYNQPLIEVEPILSYAVSSSVENNPKTVTGSFISTPVQPKADFDIQKFGYRKNLVDYRIIDASANFSSSLKNFQVQLYVNKF